MDGITTSIRTMRHSSPHQLFIEGALSLQNSGLIAFDFLRKWITLMAEILVTLFQWKKTMKELKLINLLLCYKRTTWKLFKHALLHTSIHIICISNNTGTPWNILWCIRINDGCVHCCKNGVFCYLPSIEFRSEGTPWSVLSYFVTTPATFCYSPRPPHPSKKFRNTQVY